MRSVDLTPLYRTFVGVDRVIDMLETASRADTAANGYPPFNIEDAGDDAYRIELAVAGFAEEDLSVEVRDATVFVTGRKTPDETKTYLHRGIAERAFERRFNLADHVIVTGASLVNGLLVIDLKRELPEAKKPRQIAISSSASRPAVTQTRRAAVTDESAAPAAPSGANDAAA